MSRSTCLFHRQLVNARIQIDVNEIHRVISPILFVESAVHENGALFRPVVVEKAEDRPFQRAGRRFESQAISDADSPTQGKISRDQHALASRQPVIHRPRVRALNGFLRARQEAIHFDGDSQPRCRLDREWR